MPKKYPYKFSIVTAVYNTEKYVSDAIDSVINQSIGFEDNVQLILVNDGSTDRSGEICKEYRDRYPKNIVYIEKENGGVSSARNRGLKEVKGKYVNFLDSDDKLSKNTLEEVWNFFEKHYDEIDFVSIPIQYFEGSNKEHILNFKFRYTWIVDIEENPNCIQLSSASTFFKASSLRNYKFDETLKYAEDVKFVNELLLEKKKYGVLNTTKYLYRKRETEDSAMQKHRSYKNWYFNALQDSFYYLLKLTKEKFGIVPLYYQYVVMYDLQFRLKKEDMGLLNKKEKEEYISTIKEMLKYIDDKVILNQKHYYQEHKVFALALKYDKSLDEIKKELKIKNGKIYFKDIKPPISSRIKLDIYDFKLKRRRFEIKGILKTVLPIDQLKISAISSNGEFPVTLVRYKEKDIKGIEKSILKAYRFELGIPISKSDEIEFKAEFNNSDVNIRYYLKMDTVKDYYFNKRPRRIIHFNDEDISTQKY
jgi:glycosyltransferase involved in cell wall biosynthesis